MAITVRTFDRLGPAASALGGDRGARFIGGGTLLMRRVNEGDVTITTLLRTTDPAFREIRQAGARVEIGAGVTMAGVLGERDLAFLHQAARMVGGPAVRSMATVGGNLLAPPPFGDFATALLALDAVVTVESGYGRREVPLEELLAARDRGGVGLVASVTVPRPAAELRVRKVSRVRPKGVSVLAIAAYLPRSGGRVSGARVAYGGMAPTPIRAKAVERALEGRSLDAAGIAPALAAASEGTSPPTDALATDWYRREVAPVHLRRLLLGEEG